jgi:hypothetical protein
MKGGLVPLYLGAEGIERGCRALLGEDFEAGSVGEIGARYRQYRQDE